nr:MAG TPA: hypothetical protein [Caudoviricetes sp.]
MTLAYQNYFLLIFIMRIYQSKLCDFKSGFCNCMS